jgi:hypothetical protein
MTIVRSLRADMDERDRSISRVQTIKATLADAQDRGEMATVRMYEAELKIAKTTVIDSMVRENKGGTVVGKCERRERSVCGGESDRVWCAHHVCLSTQKKHLTLLIHTTCTRAHRQPPPTPPFAPPSLSGFLVQDRDRK